MKIHPARHGRSGITLSEVIIVIVVLATVLFILFPGIFPRPSRKRGHPPTCVQNLKQIGLGLKMWAGDNLDKYPWQVSTNQGGTMEWAFTTNVYRHFQVASNEMGNAKVLKCPEDKVRKLTPFFDDRTLNNQNISYFVGLSAVEKGPVIALAGDRHLMVNKKPARGIVGLTTNDYVSWSQELHKGTGRTLLADGSVHTFSSSALDRAFYWPSMYEDTGSHTNWLAIP